MTFRDFLLPILVLVVLGFSGYGAWEIHLIEADAHRAADSVTAAAAKVATDVNVVAAKIDTAVDHADATVDRAVNNAINPLPSLFKKP